MPSPKHPGPFIKEKLIAPGMTITEMSKSLGVGRPALSNMLNGKATLSQKMALRIERAFGLSADDLMKMQSEHDSAKARGTSVTNTVKPNVLPFLPIKARQIEDWASNNIEARQRLAVFLRTLINSSGANLRHIDFPGNDNAERPGWDGTSDASEGNPWVPEGLCGWEFGTSENVKAKAQADYDKSVGAISAKEMAETIFIFVTPRCWVGKNQWVEERKSEKKWKDVRAYDASDLEQWLEQSTAGQTWFANETNLPTQGTRSLDKCWEKWSNAASPPLSPAFFNTAVEVNKEIMEQRLSDKSDKPVTIKAASTDEALAFLSQLLSKTGGDTLEQLRDRVIVFDEPGVLSRIGNATSSFIPVVYEREIEEELTVLGHSSIAIAVHPENAFNVKSDVTLGPVDHESFENGLAGTKHTPEQVTRLEKDTGRSLTVLRRQLSGNAAIRKPSWASDGKIASQLIPFLLAGIWDVFNKRDTAAIKKIAGASFDDDRFQALKNMEAPPVWAVGVHRGVTSKIDLLHTIGGALTANHLEQFFEIAADVLGEDDPALDLDADKRWAAHIFDKTREYSGVFRKSISENVTMLAVLGPDLFANRPDLNIEHRVRTLIQQLLTPLSARTLEANDGDLPMYAEAAPDIFLETLEDDLSKENPAVFSVLRSDEHDWTMQPSRTGLIWALELLCWDSVTLPRAAHVLARLAEVEIKDNWANTPGDALEAVFCIWMPQTMMQQDQRMKLAETLARKYPDVMWRIVMTQINTGSRIGHQSHKPRWRSSADGHGLPHKSWQPVKDGIQAMVRIALSWPELTVEKLCDLVARLGELTRDEQVHVWHAIEHWASGNPDDVEKHRLREKIRVNVLSGRLKRRSGEELDFPVMFAAGKAAYQALQPTNLIYKHARLFENQWVEESVEELEELESLDGKDYETGIKEQRIAALIEIYDDREVDGIVEVAKLGETGKIIGILTVESILLKKKERLAFFKETLSRLVSQNDETHVYKNLIAGGLLALTDEERSQLLAILTGDLPKESYRHLFLLAPFCQNTWRDVESLGPDALQDYWSSVVSPYFPSGTRSEINEAVESLLETDRPVTAFTYVHTKPKTIDARLLYRLLQELAKSKEETIESLAIESYYYIESFKYLNESSVVTENEMALLEFSYIGILADPLERRNGVNNIFNLERHIEKHPKIYIDAIFYAFYREDELENAADLAVPGDIIKNRAERGLALLEGLQRIPGQGGSDQIDEAILSAWIATVRDECRKLSRLKKADYYIGKLLSGAPIGEDGAWPCEPVRKALEDIASKEMARGVCHGKYNARGVHVRKPGNLEEHRLAEQYQQWAQSIAPEHPFVADHVLLSLARSYSEYGRWLDSQDALRSRLL